MIETAIGAFATFLLMSDTGGDILLTVVVIGALFAVLLASGLFTS